MKMLVVCIAIGFAILIAIAGAVIACKWRQSVNNQPPPAVLLQEEQYRITKGPLPSVPQNNSHYRSLIRQPDPAVFSQQTTHRPPPQNMQGNDDYSDDWHFGTAPWNKFTDKNSSAVDV